MSLEQTDSKKILRSLKLRERLDQGCPSFDQALFIARFLQKVPLGAGEIVAGYIPFRKEFDVRPLLEHLRPLHTLALPRVVGLSKILEFRLYDHAHPLTQNSLGVWEPPLGAPLLRPDVLVIPLVAFDKCRHRLGYGAGLYDRTLAALNQTKNVRAIGVGYGYQEVARLPSDIHDVALDAIVTDVNVF